MPAAEAQMKTTLLVPTLNEIEAVQAIMPQINRSWVDEIICVDGGSTDGTIEYFQKNGTSSSTLKLEQADFNKTLQEEFK